MRYLIKPFLLLLLITSMGHVVPGEEGGAPALSHVVLMWLNTPGDRQAIDEITRATRALARIPGVTSVKVGAAVESERAIVDDSFDVGVIFTFSCRQEMDAYLVHPMHRQAVRDVIEPLVRKIIVYDIQE
jgi:hypothetical protein